MKPCECCRLSGALPHGTFLACITALKARQRQLEATVKKLEKRLRERAVEARLRGFQRCTTPLEEVFVELEQTRERLLFHETRLATLELLGK